MESNISIDGKSYCLTSDDNYLEAMGSSFEPHMVELFKILINCDDVVLDIGANIGLTAVLFSKLGKKVYAFEPSPTTFQILQENLSRAKTENIDPINLGLGEQREQLSITFAKNNRSGGFVSDIIQPQHGHVTEAIQIESLDSYFNEYSDPISFLKIDVEGFEMSVIKGAQQLLKKHKPIVMLELNHFCLNVLRRLTVPDFLDFLRSIFPYLYAVDVDNSSIIDLHDEEQAYFVMHEHLVKFRYPNLVAGFDPSLELKLKKLESAARSRQSLPSPLLPKIKDAQGLYTKILKRLGVGSFSTAEIAATQGQLKVANCPQAVKSGEVFTLDVMVSNQSKCRWVTGGAKPVYLSYHWLDLSGNSVVYDGIRSPVGIEKIASGQQVNCQLKVVAPPMSGQLSLVVSLVQEGAFWFEERGFSPAVNTLSLV